MAKRDPYKVPLNDHEKRILKELSGDLGFSCPWTVRLSVALLNELMQREKFKEIIVSFAKQNPKQSNSERTAKVCELISTYVFTGKELNDAFKLLLDNGLITQELYEKHKDEI